MNELEWLARNVHEWPVDDRYMIDVTPDGYVVYLEEYDSRYYTKSQWLAERSRIQNKPEEWEGDYLCQRESGVWYSFIDIKPQIAHIKDEIWVSLKGHHKVYPKGEVLGDWKDTLETKSKQEVVVEDIKWNNGDIVEVNHGDFGWVEATVVGEFDDSTVCAPVGGGFISYHSHEIRKVKTEEERVVQQMESLMDTCSYEDFAVTMYKAIKSGEIKIKVTK